MTLANTVAIVRALAAIPIVWAIAAGERPLALAIFLIAASTDALDGWIARRRGATALGALIDPLADKVLVVATLAVLAAVGSGWPVTLVAVFVAARELVVGVARVRAYRRGIAIPADQIAKLKTVAEMVGVSLIIVGGRPWAVLGAGLVGVGFLISLLTLRRYLTTALA